ncbi:MAG TPA: ABC transporter substrate-binding protein [Acetobacteraceae bacterium]|nr:ABC transporter substrate-binding protein [Acetobacteraceae bacterium]
MLTRRHLLVTTAAGVAANSIAPRSEAATPANIVVMARAIDGIIGAFDPAESYETPNNEVCGNIYRKLILPDPADANKVVGDLAESWQVSPDGLVFTFQIRTGVKFDSGNTVTAEDAAFSLQRAVILNKTPAFILTQFGWNADNVDKLVRATGEYTLELTLPSVQSPSFVLYCLSATVGGVVEKARALANQANNDLGNAWLKTHSAGSGSYRLVEWLASDHIILEANPYAAVKPRIPRVVIRHVAEPATQFLLLQKGDTDIARNLTADQLKGIVNNPDYSVSKIDQLNSLYLGLNASLPQFQKVEVRQAIKFAIDYDAIANNITPNVWNVWQTFLPGNSPGAINERPFKKDVAKAKALLAAGGYPDGFEVTLDYYARSPYAEIAAAIQADLAAIGIKAQLLAGEAKQVTSKMRVRQHQMNLVIWFPDYLDPNSNAQAFNANPDDSDGAKLKLPAWRCHFFDQELTEAVDRAVKELDPEKRMEIYAKMQSDAMARSPFVFLLQSAEVATMRKGVSGLRLGLMPDYTNYAGITKS